MSLMRILYTLLLALASPLLLWGLYRKRPNKPEFGSRWKEHFGFTPPLAEDETSPARGVIWVHAVSVGEVLASQKLVLTLKQRYPTKRILVTTTTSTGAEQVAKMGVEHRYMPIDFGWCVNRFLTTVQPDIMLIIETELWPNTLHTVSKRQVPIVLVNGRLSDKSQRHYQQLRLLMTPALQCVQHVLSVHEDDSARFRQLGSKNVTTTGSLKYDITVNPDTQHLGQQLREKLGTSRLVWIGASTHSGEDEILFRAYQLAKKQLPNLLLMLVPRHPERFDDVATSADQHGLTVERRSHQKVAPTSEQTDVYLADTMGEMMCLLAASDIVFMGGSLVGRKVGGHNFIEPAVLSKPCLTGSSYYNFADLAEQLIQAQALAVVSDGQEIAEQLMMFASAPILDGGAGYDIVRRNQGALDNTLNLIQRLIENSP